MSSSSNATPGTRGSRGIPKAWFPSKAIMCRLNSSTNSVMSGSGFCVGWIRSCGNGDLCTNTLWTRRPLNAVPDRLPSDSGTGRPPRSDQSIPVGAGSPFCFSDSGTGKPPRCPFLFRLVPLLEAASVIRGLEGPRDPTSRFRSGLGHLSASVIRGPESPRDARFSFVSCHFWKLLQ